MLTRAIAISTVLIAGLPAAGAGQSLRTLATIPTPNLMRLLDQQTGGQAGQPGNQGVRVVWDDSPSLRFGSAARLDFRFRLQEDVRKPGDAPLGFETWQLKRLRGGIDGELFDRVQFQLERELYEQTDLDQDDEGYSETLWKDVFVDVNIVDALQVRAGRFKIPFGGEQLTGTTNLDFAFRTLGATYLSPSRDTGVAVHGDIGAVNYWIGGFEHDGDNSRSRRIVGGDEAIAGRVTVQAWNQNNGPGILEISGAFMRSTVSDESVLPNGLRARTVLSKYDFYEEVFVKGQRIRLQGDVDFMGGPFSARAEYTWVTDERLEQGFGSDALPEARARAWYASGSWVITGERKDRPVEPRHWLGAVEVAGRLERIRFGSVTGVDTPFRNPRAETIYPVANRVATIGVNWYITRWGKIQLNAIREQIDDVERSPVLNGAAFWSRIVRFQLAI